MNLWFIAAAAVLVSGSAIAQSILPRPETPLQGFIGRTPAESAPAQWPKYPEAPKGAPNVIVIMTDDVGFGASSTFGGPIPTSAFDALAKSGLRYNGFHVTALCSPTRAALMTGRNNHDVGMALTEESVTGYEGYTGMIPKSAGTIAEILKQNGFNTAQFGKWHLTPYTEMGPTGPSGRVGETIPNRFALDASMSVGEATGAPVSTDYETPFKLTAILDELTLTLN